MKPQAVLIVMGYIAGITLANLAIVWFGPWATPINSFILIAFTFIARDALHELWRGSTMFPIRMLAMIVSAGVISYLINPDAGRIAIASAAAFIISESIDWSAYIALDKQPWLIRSNGSNVAGVLADSILFPLLAFGNIEPILVIIGAQFFAKLGGGFFWSFVFKHTIKPDERRARMRAA